MPTWLLILSVKVLRIGFAPSPLCGGIAPVFLNTQHYCLSEISEGVSSNSDVDHCVSKVARFGLQHTVGSKITVLEIWLNAENFSSIKLPNQGTVYPQRCFRWMEMSGWCLTGCFIHRIRGWAGLEMVAKRKISTHHELSPEFLTFQLTAQSAILTLHQ